MKKIITYSILMAITMFSACRKSDNPRIPELARVPVPSLTKDPSGSGTIIVSDLPSFVAKVNVDVFFKTDALPQKMDLVVIKNGNKADVKVIKAGITTYPTLVTFTGPQLDSLFAGSGGIQTCDFFDVGVNITAPSGVVYDAFPPLDDANAYGSGVAGQYGGVKTSLNFPTKVEFDPSVYAGNFKVVSDEFADFPVGSTVVLTPIDATHFSFTSPAVSNPLPIIVAVDPATLKVSITQQKIGDYFLWEPTYTNPKVQTISTNAANRVIPCSVTFSVALDYSVDQGAFGEYVLVLKKG